MAKKHTGGRVNGINGGIKVVLSVAFVFFVAVTIYQAEAYTIEDDKVLVDNARLYFSAEPHTIHFDDDHVNLEFISKQFGGNIDIALGFDTSIIKPKSARAKINEEWKDISNAFTPLNHDYGGMNRWYVLDSVNINEDQLYEMRVDFDVLSTGSGKYWICAKPSSQTLQESIASDNFLCLDPWFNISFMFKIPINASCLSCASDINKAVLLNDSTVTIDGHEQIIWCNYTVSQARSIVGYLYFNDNTDYQCVNGDETARVSMNIDQGNGTNFGSFYTDMTGWWHLNTTIDSSIYGFDGTAQGATPTSSGKIGNAFDFDGTEDYIDIGIQSAHDGGTALTVMGWINLDADESSTLASQWDRSKNNRGWLLGTENEATGAKAIAFFSNAEKSVSGAPGTYVGAWNHVAFTYDGNQMILYVNGDLVDSDSTMSGAMDTPGTETAIGAGLGADGSTWNYWDANGQIDEVKIFNRTLSTDEIIAEYNNTVDGHNYASLGDVLNRSNSSILAVPFDIPDFSFSSSAFVTGMFIEFNTSAASTDFVMLSSMNVEKISGGGSNTVSSRVLLDGVTVNEEVLRTVTGIGDVGSTGLSPLNFNVSSGEHNMTVEFSRTGTGSILIDNIDLNLIEMFSIGGDPIRNQFVNVSYNHSSLSFVNAFNWTMNKTINSSTYIVVKQSATKLTSGISELTYRFFNFQENDFSPEWMRTLDGAADIGSLSGVYIDPNEIGAHDHSIQSKQSDTGDTIFVEGTLIDFDMADSDGILINFFQTSNPLTNSSSTLTFGAGTHIIASQNITIETGGSFFLSAMTSFNSVSGAQTPTYIIDSDDTSCTTEKDRSLSNNNDIANVFMYWICGNLTLGQTYGFNLKLVVPAGESVEQIDESFNGFETQSFPINIGNLPPIPGEITNPTNGSTVSGLDMITWFEFVDSNGGLVTYNVSLFNPDGSFNQTLGDGITATSLDFNWNTIIDGNYSLVVEGCDPTGLCSNSSITIVVIITPPEIPRDASFCSDNRTFYIREVARESTLISGLFVTNITIDETFIDCDNGCSNWTLSKFGLPGCEETDFVLALIFIVFILLIIAIIRVAAK